MKISLITVCRNAEATIEKALQSVVHQTYQNIEYLVIDGNSTDKTKEIISKYRDKIHSYIREPDKNWADAMNKGMKLAKGDFVGFVNADDYLHDPDVVKDVVGTLQMHPDCMILYGDTEIRPNPRLSKEITVFKPPKPEELLDGLTLNVGPFMGSSYYSRHVFSTVGYFKTEYEHANDTEWFLRFFEYWDHRQFHYYNRTIYSYSMCGHSSKDVGTTLRAAFGFIDQSPILNSDVWLGKRVKNLQEKVISLEKLYHATMAESMNRLHTIQSLEDHMERSAPAKPKMKQLMESILRKFKSGSLGRFFYPS